MAKLPANSLGRRIKEFRLERGMTQKRMAAYLGIGKATLVRIERGYKCLDLTGAKIERRLSEAQVAA